MRVLNAFLKSAERMTVLESWVMAALRAWATMEGPPETPKACWRGEKETSWSCTIAMAHLLAMR